MKNLSLFALLLLTLFACRQDMDKMGDAVTLPDPPIIIEDYNPSTRLITSSVSGIVYDEQESPIMDAVIKLRGKSYTTNDEGYFFAEDVELDAEGSFYTVEKNGYFKGSRRFYPREDAISNTKVQLMKINSLDTFVASEGKTITDDVGLIISFPPNAIKKADGTLYEGIVDVAAKWLNPAADNVTELMPGALFGLNSALEEVNLATYGMVAVELFGENGEILNIADGKTAQLTVPIPDEMIAGAPDEIPIWSFEDETYGIWVEEGKATLVDGKYTGSVSHFSFWNYDVFFPIVNIEGKLVTQNGFPIADATIIVRIAGTNIARSGQTNSKGYFSGPMPKDEILELTAGYGAQSCDFEVSTIGPFDANTNIGNLRLTNTGSSFELTGSVVDCNGIPMTEGRVKIRVGNELTTHYLDGSSTYSIAVLNCENETEVSVSIDDLANLVGSAPTTFSISPTIDAGTIAACGTVISEFLTLTVNGQTKTFDSGEIFLEGGQSFSMNIYDQNGNDSTSLSFYTQNIAIGTYDQSVIERLNIFTDPPSFSSSMYLNCFSQGGMLCSEITAFTYNVTVNEGLGGNHEGNFNGVGTFIENNNTATSIPFSAVWKLPIID